MTGVWDHPTAAELSDAVETGTIGEALRGHLAVCVECRVRAARLEGNRRPSSVPSDSALGRILAADAALRPDAAAVAGGTADAAKGRAPREGELWRAGAREALLVWVRRVLDGAVDAVPVVLDTDMADEQTLLLPPEASPLGAELGVVTSLRSHLHPDAFLSLVGELPQETAARIAEVSRAAEEGRVPVAPVGPQVLEFDDQRVEYQQTIASVMAEMTPAAWARTHDTDDTRTDDAGPALYILIDGELPARHPCRVHRSLPAAAPLPDGSMLRAVARVGYADSSVLVALLADWQAAPEGDLVEAGRRLLEQEPGAGAAAICGGPPLWPATVLEWSATREAYESPGGRLAPPPPLGDPLYVIDALAKYLDLRTPSWDATEEASAVPTADLADRATAAAAVAMADLAAQGSRAHTPAKTQAWTALPADLPADLGELVRRVVGGSAPSDAVDWLLDGDRR